MKAVALFLIAVASVCAAPTERVEKSAVLLLPAELPQGEDIVASVLLRWDEDDPLAVHTVVVGGRLCTYGEVLVYAEDGREMPMIYPATMPLVPTGSKEVKKGETLTIGLYMIASIWWTESRVVHEAARSSRPAFTRKGGREREGAL